MNPTNIPWTHLFGPGSGFTWNPITGCSAVSPGCANCYARTLHNQRHEAFKQGKAVPECYSTPFHDVRFHPDRLDQPLRRRKPAGVFVCSMSDLFHQDVTDEQLDMVFVNMALAHWHLFFVLTKRPERMLAYINGMTGERWDAARRPLYEQASRDWNAALAERTGFSLAYRGWPLPNVWLGITAEDQQRADERIPILLDTPAAVRFVSYEPALGPLHLHCIEYPGAQEGILDALRGMTCDDDPPHPGLDWVIAGGESGNGARPPHSDWFRQVRDDCAAAGVPYFHKQNGGAGRNHGGHLLDGQEHREFPEVKP